MAKPKPAYISEWSYTRWSTHDQCNLKGKFKFVDKLPDPPGPAADRGIFYHSIAEMYINRKMSTFPVELQGLGFDEKFDQLREQEPLTEHRIGLTRQWTETGFFGKDVWGRVVYDVIYYTPADKTVHIIDHKTGKMYPEHEEQLDLYNLTGLLLFPDAEQSVAEDWYLDQGAHIGVPRTMSRKLVEPMKQFWQARIDVMENDRIYAARPGRHCNWCAYAKRKGGPCSFG